MIDFMINLIFYCSFKC